MRVVLDTNVLVSGLLSPFGAPAEVLRLALAGNLTLCFDGRIQLEYREVLSRPRFGFDAGDVEALLGLLEVEGLLVNSAPLPKRLPDPDDEPFLAVALAAGAEFLITGNLRHYPPRARQGVQVVSPRSFLEARTKL